MAMPTGQSDLDNPSLRYSSQVILSCVKLTIQSNHDSNQNDL